MKQVVGDAVVLPLGSRALDILIYLAERPGELIAKQELIDHVWSDLIVEEGSLRIHVAVIRKALGDGQLATDTSQTPRDGASQTPVHRPAIHHSHHGNRSSESLHNSCRIRKGSNRACWRSGDTD